MKKIIEYTGGLSVILGVFFTYFGASWLHFVGIAVLLADPILILSTRFYRLPSNKARLRDLGILVGVVATLVFIFGNPDPACPANTLCIPSLRLPSISFSLPDIGMDLVLAVLSLAAAVACVVLVDVFLLVRRSKPTR